MTLTPAYGRDYKSAEAVLTDWKRDFDFVVALTGQKANRADLTNYEGDITIRYHRLTRSVIIGE